MKAKRQNAAIMALLVFFFSVFPVKRSEAFAPPLIYAAYMTTSTGAGTYTIAALAGAIGIAGMYFTVKDATDNEVRIPLGPNTVNSPPAPVAPPTASGTTSQAFKYSPSSPTYSSCGAAAQAWLAVSQGENCSYYSEGQWHYDGQKNNVFVSCNGRNVTYYQTCGTYTSETVTVSTLIDAGTVSVCPTGYVDSGSGCVLNNPRKVTDDKRCDLLIQNGQFATADDLNCSGSVDGSKVAPMIRNGNVIAYGKNSSGQPLMWEVTPGPQTWTVKEYEQVQTATQTQVKQTTATIDAATSAVTSVQTQTSPGSISSPGASTVPTVTDPATQPTSPTNTPTTTTKADGIVFPNDYARTGEAQRAADSITDLMKPTSEVADPTVPEWADNWGSTFNPLKAWSVPGHSSVCPVGSFNWNGSTYTIDSHCQLISDYWSALQSAAVVLWTVLALFILLGA